MSPFQKSNFRGFPQLGVQAEADFRELVESVESMQLDNHQKQKQQRQQQQQRQQSPGAGDAGPVERARAEAARLSSDNAALRRRLERTHRLVGAMQVPTVSLQYPSAGHGCKCPVNYN